MEKIQSVKIICSNNTELLKRRNTNSETSKILQGSPEINKIMAKKTNRVMSKLRKHWNSS